MLLSDIPIQAQAVMKVQTGSSITTTGGVVIQLSDVDLDNDGTINQQPGQGSFAFTGNANNTITGLAVPLFDMLQIAKAGNAGIALNQHIQVGSGITFTSGIINLNSKNILLQPVARLIGESETSHITGGNGGYVEITNTLNAPAAVNPGNLGALITSGQNLGPVTIRRGHQAQKNASGYGSSILRYYDLLPANNIALQATLHINYLEAELNALNENILSLWQSQDQVHWTDLGFATRSATSNYVEQTGINSFYRYTLTEVNNALPLIWGSFTTHCQGSQSTITWQTMQEQNTASFIIRRSANGIVWVNTGNIKAAGNSQAVQSYTFTDPQPLAGSSYYQIIQLDVDGRQTFSPVLVNRCGQPEGMSVYPNPVKNNCIVAIQSATSYTTTLRLYNSVGALLKLQYVGVREGNNQFVLSLSNYPPGLYSLVVAGRDGKANSVQLEKN